MRYYKLAIFVGFIMLLLAACGKETTDESDKINGEEELADEINIFNWGESLPQEILDGFEEEFGVKVIYSTYDSDEAMLTKVQSETVPYDVVFPTGPYLEEMISQDLVHELDMDNIPNYENISEQWTGLPTDPENKYSIPYNYGTTGIVYNKEKVEKPTSWKDLWKPEYKGHVTLLEDSDEVINMSLQNLGYDINNPSDEEIKEAGEELKSLVPNLLSLTPAPSNLFADEQAWIGHSYCGEAGIAAKENPNIDCVLPEEGGITWYTGIVVPKTSASKHTAETFINYFLRPEVSIKMTEAYPYPSPNEGAVELYNEEMQDVPGLNPSDEEIEDAELETVFKEEQMSLINKVVQEALID